MNSSSLELDEVKAIHAQAEQRFRSRLPIIVISPYTEKSKWSKEPYTNVKAVK